MAESLLEKIPALSDSDLAALFANAQRLSTAGSTKQQSAANELLPVLQAETQQRSETKSATLKTRNAERAKARKKAKAAPVEGPEEEADEE